MLIIIIIFIIIIIIIFVIIIIIIIYYYCFILENKHLKNICEGVQFWLKEFNEKDTVCADNFLTGQSNTV